MENYNCTCESNEFEDPVLGRYCSQSPAGYRLQTPADTLPKSIFSSMASKQINIRWIKTSSEP